MHFLGMQNSARRYGPTVLVYGFVAVASALTEWLSFFVAARYMAPFAAAFAAFFVAERPIDGRLPGGASER
jgi:hypothetical protein